MNIFYVKKHMAEEVYIKYVSRLFSLLKADQTLDAVSEIRTI